MRCLNRTCTLEALDGGNYCQLHLKHMGASRPGISAARSASGGRLAEKSHSVMSAQKAQSGKAAAKRATGNPMLMGKATPIKTTTDSTRPDKKRSSEAPKKGG